MLSGKTILLGITGGIAAYKMCELIRMYKRANANVLVVCTPNALNFVTKLTLQNLSQNDVAVEEFDVKDFKPEHISYADSADIMVIAPATANTISKIATGVCDNLLTSIACAFTKPVIIAPAMNCNMWENPVLQENYKPLEGKKIVITSGGTIEDIDPVRYISNYSSGKMGLALADTAKNLGADVTLITTKDIQRRYNVIKVKSAIDMKSAVENEFESADCVIMAAAVADYRVKEVAPQKMKKTSEDEITLTLVKNPDILKEISSIKKSQIVVGFCAESENLIENAKEKIAKKGCDYLIANDISRKDIGFSSDYNEVTILDKNGNMTKIERADKATVARKIFEAIYG